ncbi:CheR family methyltransferase [Anaeromyxobacter diazotrophicus]|uniref:Protein-glutamate O-methyltransferase n=1 Tax=Anaeromyxobacter diazotrophicus TaxID=2590199 RepID=A0A7I9VH10_9BACT|nr:CheR family methyltransferase [Anaeromyxobacter diazotrophicus]GEJ55674.1 protein-glutamate O-methyltransferase [Anaeromyxobacter diazotrophicus]
MIELAPEHLRELAELLRERVGLCGRDGGDVALRLAVAARFEAPDPPAVEAGRYVEHLRTAAGEEELRRLLPLVTVGKTSFFRDERQFEALRALLPGLLAGARAERRPLAIWSAGCATGEEPWSIAIAAAEAGARPGELELLATDLNPEAAARAQAGTFLEERLREVPPEARARWFEVRDGRAEVGPALRALFTGAATHNLVSGSYPRPARGAWDVVFCRNVLIYFSTSTTVGVLERFRAALAPGGWLFLGYSESLFHLYDGFDLEQVEGAFLYRRPGGAESPAAPVAATSTSTGTTTATPAATGTATGTAAAIPTAGGAVHRPAEDVLAEAAQLMDRGRFMAARDLLLARLSAGEDDLGLRLTLAHLHDLLQAPEQAAACYREAVAREPLRAEPHLFLGVHLYGRSDPEGASAELSRALFLDPDLALAHYFLGRCREAQHDLERARLCYRNALAAHERCPEGHRQRFLGHYPDLPQGGASFARAARYALEAL